MKCGLAALFNSSNGLIGAYCTDNVAFGHIAEGVRGSVLNCQSIRGIVMFKNIGLLILGSSVLLAGCKVDIYANAPPSPGYTYFEGASGAIYADTNDSESSHQISISDSSFSESIKLQTDSADSEFWYWSGGMRNLCGNSTDKLCALDASWASDVDSSNPVFSDDLRFNLVGVARPKTCMPPAELRDLVSSGQIGTVNAIRLCGNEIYDGISDPYGDPINMYSLYVDPGVTLKNSNIKTNYLFVFNEGNRATFDNSKIYAHREIHARGLNIISGSDVAGGIDQIGFHSVELSNITIRDSWFSVGSIYNGKQPQIERESRLLTFKNVRASGDQTQFGINVRERSVRFANVSLIGIQAIYLAAGSWYAETDYEFQGGSVQMRANVCHIIGRDRSRHNIMPCTQEDFLVK